jgi:hypothetical protein
MPPAMSPTPANPMTNLWTNVKFFGLAGRRLIAKEGEYRNGTALGSVGIKLRASATQEKSASSDQVHFMLPTSPRLTAVI